MLPRSNPRWEVPLRPEPQRAYVDACSNAESEGTLRRRYTRAMPDQVRPIDILAESISDVESQWGDVVQRLLSVPQANQGTDFRIVRGSLGPVVSQIKAVKQELLWWWNKHRTSQEERWRKIVATLAGSKSDCGTKYASMHGAFATLHAEFCAAPPLASCAAEEQECHLLNLGRRAWAWSLVLALATDDLELLTTTLPLAASQWFSAPCGLSARRATRTGAVAETAGARGADDEHTYILTTAFGVTPANASAADANPPPLIPDQDVVLACELLYSAVTSDDVALTLSLDRTTRRLGCGLDNGMVCHRKCERSDPPNGNASLSLQCGPPPPHYCHDQRSFWATVHLLASATAAGEYDRGYRLFAEGSDGSPGSAGRGPCYPLRQLCPFMYLFAAALEMHVTRRRLIADGLGSAWRPVVDVAARGGSQQSLELRPECSTTIPYSVAESILKTLKHGWMAHAGVGTTTNEEPKLALAWPMPPSLVATMFLAV